MSHAVEIAEDVAPLCLANCSTFRGLLDIGVPVYIQGIYEWIEICLYNTPLVPVLKKEVGAIELSRKCPRGLGHP